MTSIAALVIWTMTESARAQSVAYGAYGLNPTGSTRVLAMGGAFTGLADDASAAGINPAGLALSRWTLDLQGGTNRVVNREFDYDGDGAKEGLPYWSSFLAAGLNVGAVGIGVAYSTPFDLTSDFAGASSAKRSLKIQDYDAAVAVALGRYFALGAGLRLENVALAYRDPSLGIDTRATAKKLLPVLGVLLHADRKMSLGISWTPERRYDIDESLNTAPLPTTGDEWFHDVVIPQRLTLGASVRTNQRLRWVGDVDIYQPVNNSILVGTSEISTTGKILNSQQALIHGGFEFEVIQEKKVGFIWRGGGYQEPRRTEEGADRFHFTMGIEARFGVIVFAAAYDQAPDFSNVAQSVSVSLGAL